MKRVAIIGADFVPSSLPPATRIRFFAKHLAAFDWDPIVITTDPDYYDWEVDSENERLLPDTVQVIRTKAWRSSWTRRIGFSDIGMRSIWHHWQALKKICRETKVDLVFIPVPPSVPMILGRLGHMKFDIPYVVDYIDPWITEYYWKMPKKARPPKWPLAYAMSRMLEPFALKNVGHITGVSRGTTDSVIARYSSLSVTDATEIPYGAEPEDFDYLRRHPRTNSIFNKLDGLFHLSYVGACIPGMHSTIRAIFHALRLGLDNEPELFEKVRLHFVGTSYSANGAAPKLLSEIAGEMEVENYVDEQPARVPYLASLQIMLDSDGLFLVGSDEAHYTASKVFPYLLARKPLLAVFHEQSSVVDILKGSETARTVSYNLASPPMAHVAAIREALKTILLHKSTTMDHGSHEPAFLSARMMTARLARAFDQALLKSCEPHSVKEHPVIL